MKDIYYKIGLVIIVLIIIIFLYIENNKLIITKLEINSSKLPKEFIDTKIIHLSDLHNKEFGKDNRKLIDKIITINPNFIVFTGDIIDKRIYKEDIALSLLRELTNISKVYYVTGNHEWECGKYNLLKKKIEKLGVVVLSNEYIEIKKADSSIYILGVDDPNKYYKQGIEDKEARFKKFNDILKKLVEKVEKNKFKILLSHRPEFFDEYKEHNIDIAFSGHVHGGQVRIPFIGGLYSPSQGIFPKITSGIYKKEDASLVLSRGLGNSSIAPQRLFNKPEIIVLTLK